MLIDMQFLFEKNASSRSLARKFYWGVLLKEMWTFSYCSNSANHSPGVIDELIYYGECIAHIHEGL